ncbi:MULTISPECIES: phosphate ABC transporter substrate-binding protein [Pseudomonas]|uniref:phosphate ABC transporter substrate-binding protein n=1 Tax=Pseudomonas TaxID=286 RepID=UPI001BE70662|nr:MULTISPECIES: phosphate ABC transporter substrate-binding protein [Pseudomonas]MBT2338416.1 phosphate ABC transporter substrate-binding protein [Pseudomonas fluorescens]MCD4531118.1 phosphate ABC transporter substrate-binding protein [Pseudomonas sp. C3-2018]
MRLLRHTRCAVAGIVLSAGSALVMADVVVVVSNASPVKALADNQVANIFLGKTNRFPEGGQAVPVDLPEGSAIRDEFYTRFTGKSAAQLKAHWSKIIFTGRGQPPEALSNSEEVKKHLAGHPDGIGYIDAREVDDSVRVLPSAPQ